MSFIIAKCDIAFPGTSKKHHLILQFANFPDFALDTKETSRWLWASIQLRNKSHFKSTCEHSSKSIWLNTHFVVNQLSHGPILALQDVNISFFFSNVSVGEMMVIYNKIKIKTLFTSELGLLKYTSWI